MGTSSLSAGVRPKKKMRRNEGNQHRQNLWRHAQFHKKSDREHAVAARQLKTPKIVQLQRNSRKR